MPQPVSGPDPGAAQLVLFHAAKREKRFDETGDQPPVPVARTRLWQRRFRIEIGQLCRALAVARALFCMLGNGSVPGDDVLHLARLERDIPSPAPKPLAALIAFAHSFSASRFALF